jgi:hypothetical protein
MLVSPNKNKETQKWWHLQCQINKKRMSSIDRLVNTIQMTMKKSYAMRR